MARIVWWFNWLLSPIEFWRHDSRVRHDAVQNDDTGSTALTFDNLNNQEELIETFPKAPRSQDVNYWSLNRFEYAYPDFWSGPKTFVQLKSEGRRIMLLVCLGLS